MSKNHTTLLTIAAEMRSGGASWDAIGLCVNRKGTTCAQWPSRYKSDWDFIYWSAQQKRYDEVANEALATLRHMLRCDDNRLKLRAIEVCLRYAPKPVEVVRMVPAKEETERDREWAHFRKTMEAAHEEYNARRAAAGMPPLSDDQTCPEVCDSDFDPLKVEIDGPAAKKDAAWFKLFPMIALVGIGLLFADRTTTPVLAIAHPAKANQEVVAPVSARPNEIQFASWKSVPMEFPQVFLTLSPTTGVRTNAEQKKFPRSQNGDSQMRRLFSAMTLTLAFVLPQPVRAADSSAPVLLARFASIDKLFDQGEYLAKLAGQEELGKQVIGFFRAARGKTGLDGVDTKRPAAICALAPEGLSIPFYIMVPIADQHSFEEDLFAKRFRIELKKDKEGIRSFQLPILPVTFYIRYANDYAYITALDTGFLEEKKLPSPKILGEDSNSLVDLSVRLDLLPAQIKLLVLGQVEMNLAAEKKRDEPNQTTLQKELRAQMFDTAVGALKTFLMETKEITFKLVVDPKSEELSLEWNLTPVEGSTFAKDLAALKSVKNVFAGIAPKNAIVRSNVYVALPTSIQKPLSAVINESFEEALKNTPAELDKVARNLFHSIGTNAKAGVWDGGFAVMGPDKENHLSFIYGVRMYMGGEFDAAFRDVIKALPGEVGEYFNLDVAKFGKVGIHSLKVESFINDDLGRVFDKKSNVYFASADDRYLLYLGPDGKEVLKDALEKPVGTSKLLDVSVSVGRIAPYFNLEKAEAMRATAEAIFGKDYKNDTATLSLEGGASLKFQIKVPGKVVKFIGAIVTAE